MRHSTLDIHSPESETLYLPSPLRKGNTESSFVVGFGVSIESIPRVGDTIRVSTMLSPAPGGERKDALLFFLLRLSAVIKMEGY